MFRACKLLSIFQLFRGLRLFPENKVYVQLRNDQTTEMCVFGWWVTLCCSHVCKWAIIKTNSVTWCFLRQKKLLDPKSIKSLPYERGENCVTGRVWVSRLMFNSCYQKQPKSDVIPHPHADETKLLIICTCTSDLHVFHLPPDLFTLEKVMNVSISHSFSCFPFPHSQPP